MNEESNGIKMNFANLHIIEQDINCCPKGYLTYYKIISDSACKYFKFVFCCYSSILHLLVVLYKLL